MHWLTVARIVDSEDQDITGPGATGELLVRGPTIIPGYYSETNHAAFDNEGYFRTGDIVTCDASSKWYIVDRKKELIKVRGFQVSPSELEAVLLQHPKIVDAAVIGVPSFEGEQPRAYVVAAQDAGTLHVDEVMGWCAQRLAGYKRLSGGVVVVEELPRNASGKLLKRALREWAAEQRPQRAKM